MKCSDAEEGEQHNLELCSELQTSCEVNSEKGSPSPLPLSLVRLGQRFLHLAAFVDAPKASQLDPRTCSAS
jgi:hypothetical protein